ncbi:hypothetical protein ACFL6G_08180 [candidate division KSB1 bacterium]
MKKLFIIFAVVFAAASVNGQERKIHYTTGIGKNHINSPVEFKNSMNNGFDINGAGYYKFNDWFYSGLHTGFHFFGLDKNAIENGYHEILSVKGGETIITSLMLCNKYIYDTQQLSPFIETGYGLVYYHRNKRTTKSQGWGFGGPFEITTVQDSINEVRFGFRFSGGFEINLPGKYGMQIELDYFNGTGLSEKSEFVSTGIRFKF